GRNGTSHNLLHDDDPSRYDDALATNRGFDRRRESFWQGSRYRTHGGLEPDRGQGPGVVDALVVDAARRNPGIARTARYPSGDRLQLGKRAYQNRAGVPGRRL